MQDEAPPTEEYPEDLEPTEVLDQPDHAIIEYGISQFIKDNDGPLYTYIRFPQGGHTTDDVIYEWAQSMNNQITTEFRRIQDSDPNDIIGEINIQFDSFMVDNRYVGVFQHGEYSYYLAMPPEEIIQTFNIDLETRTILEATDILDFSQSDAILELLNDRTIIEHPETYGHLGFIDESWLSQLVIGNEGIIVILEQHNQFLPETFPTLTVTLPYAELESTLLIRRQPPLSAPPTPDRALTTVPDLPPPDDGDLSEDDYGYDTDYGDDAYGDDTGSADDDESSETPQNGEIDPSLPMIALTFDDGPGAYTEQLLDLFEQYGVRVTFFTVGNLADANAESLSRASRLGNEVAGKSWDHRNLAKLTATDVEAQIMDTSNTIEAITGQTAPFFRPPYGAVSPTMRDVAEDLGFSIVNWTLDSRDWDTRDANAIFEMVMTNILDGVIVLNHETHGSTLEAYRNLIPALIERDFQFVTVSELFYHRFGGFEPGQVYYGR